MTTTQMVCLGLLLLVYGVVSVPEIIKWKHFSPGFVKWGYPEWWALVTPIIKLLGAVCLLFAISRPFGFFLCNAVALAAAATVIWHKDAAMYKVTLPATLVTIIVSVVFYL